MAINYPNFRDRNDWEALCDPADGKAVFVKWEYDTEGTVIGSTAVYADGTPYAGLIDSLVVECPADSNVNQVSFDTGPFNTTTPQELLPAAGVGIINNITTLTLSNSSAVLAKFNVLDGITLLNSVYVDAESNVVITYPTPLKSSPNTALNISTDAAIADALASGNGFTL